MKTITVCVGRILGVEETDRCPDCVDYVPLADYERLRRALIDLWEPAHKGMMPGKSALNAANAAIAAATGGELWTIKKQKVPMKAVYYRK